MNAKAKETQRTNSSSRSRARPAPPRGSVAKEARDAGNAMLQHGEALYDRFAQRFHELYEKGGERTREGMERAIATTREQLSAAGEFSLEQGRRFESYLRRDLARTERELRTLGAAAAARLNPSRLGAGALAAIAGALQSTGDAVSGLADKAESALEYTTGEITSAGTLTCVACGHELRMARTATVPPCPACHATRFRKGY